MSSSQAVVRWETVAPTTGHVRYGTTRVLDRRTPEEAAAPAHRVVLAGLAPSQKYFYAVYQGDEIRSDLMAFRADATKRPPPSVKGHEGIFIRLESGLGMGRTVGEESYAGRVGYAVSPGLIVHANLVLLNSSKYDLDILCQDNCDPSTEVTGHHFIGYGLGVTAYSPDNHFLSLSGLIGSDTQRHQKNSHDFDRRAMAAAVTLGHEWKLSEEWGMGLGFELLRLWSIEKPVRTMDGPDPGSKLPATTAQLLFTATWN